MASLTSDQLRRYARHVVLPEIGEAGQARLLASSVLVIGVGGLGSPALAYLAAGGVGRLGIVEPDRVELSNLQRQLLFETADIGRAKVQAAADRIHEINPDCTVETHELRLDAGNAHQLIAAYDLVVDASDNFETRFTVADSCSQLEKPLVSAAIVGFSAQLSTFKPYLGAPHPSYRCLVSTQPERERSCAQEGIIGPLAGMLGSMQALEAMKELLGIGESFSGRVLIIDGLAMRMRYVILPRSYDHA
ncbi:MAG: HesA/MoeB/ThiF family protein [Rickettsiales bacterium]|nr:HesA/MoeB/ThiF family protein [Rickettsiales bacterium]